jgi:murein DD-endopeptidase / murein LD-carboxypeptidase
MKKLLCSVLLIFPFLLAAQDTIPRADTIRVHRDSSDTFHRFYAKYGLNPDSAKNAKLYSEVYDWIGTRYHYAGHSKQGVDCSGFVAAMYQAAYSITLCGGSADLFTQVDTVNKSNLREGDILFFKIRKGQISHVGIYLGNNKFAHASVHGGVMINDLDEEYYKKYFYCGGRLKNR